jgi:hypothetical protein
LLARPLQLHGGMRAFLLATLLPFTTACPDEDEPDAVIDAAPPGDCGFCDTDAENDANPTAECGPRPGGCDDVPADLENDPQCGTTICGAWERCDCVEGEWQTTYVDCFGCPDAAP